MKKILAILIVSLATRISFAEPPSAGWNFGTDTYGQHDSQLILNSLSDRYGISTFQTPTQSLGTNDYIGENGVKNTLALDGYTKAYDYNPNSTTGYGYSSVYNQPLPNVPLTKLTYMGLDGDPTKAQDVYVLTSEYNALSAQGQASSISTLNTGLATTNSNLAVTNTNVANNTVAIANETVRATGAEKVLTTDLTNETSARITGDAALQSQVNSTNDRVSALSSRVDNLERVKVMADLNVRILDTKKYTVGFFDMWDGTNNRNFAFGARLTYKLGKSYEEKVLEKQLKRIEALERVLNKIANQ